MDKTAITYTYIDRNLNDKYKVNINLNDKYKVDTNPYKVINFLDKCDIFVTLFSLLHTSKH